MDTKEHQWRLLNTLALHEMSAGERQACAELDALSARLESLVSECKQTERVVRRCRAQRFQQHLSRVAAKPIHHAVAHLRTARYFASAQMVVDSGNAIVIRREDAETDVVGEIQRLQMAAERFRQSAADAGVFQLAPMADVLDDLAATVTTEAEVLVDAACDVTRAAHDCEIARSSMLIEALREDPALLPDSPSFVTD